MNITSEIKNILPVVLLNIIQEYVGENVILDTNIYSIVVSSLAKIVEKQWEEHLIGCGHCLLWQLIVQYPTLDLVLDILNDVYIKENSDRFWAIIYSYIPIQWVPIFVDKYGTDIINSEYADIGYNRFEPEERQYKISKIDEYKK